ncbi:hypothetical protein BRADI_2g29278v3 [Brachypodium distachyon]|uniref:Uncharacterized protein n=1 Tax=Brachypodium distachyon TaxID=15368 RepID=A0A2K2DB42_BRADI|nr:hypothetical protein BRADI_2g29278v3 [Brachypodium distachyon]
MRFVLSFPKSPRTSKYELVGKRYVRFTEHGSNPPETIILLGLGSETDSNSFSFFFRFFFFLSSLFFSFPSFFSQLSEQLDL